MATGQGCSVSNRLSAVPVRGLGRLTLAVAGASAGFGPSSPRRFTREGRLAQRAIALGAADCGKELSSRCSQTSAITRRDVGDRRLFRRQNSLSDRVVGVSLIHLFQKDIEELSELPRGCMARLKLVKVFVEFYEPCLEIHVRQFPLPAVAVNVGGPH